MSTWQAQYQNVNIGKARSNNHSDKSVTNTLVLPLVLCTTLLYDLPLDTVQNKEVETYLVSEPHYQRTQRGCFTNKYSMNRLQLQWANYIYNQGSE